MSYNPAIILVTPQLGENIGAAARIMANFGFCDLRVVNPRDGWPNKKAEIMAAGGLEVLNGAKIYNDLQTALGDLEQIYACSARSRKIYKDYVSIKDHVANIKSEIQTNNQVKIGLMFGSERCGLLNDEIMYAKEIIYINAAESYPILNLAQAVSIMCYEYYNIYNNVMARSSKYKARQAKVSEIVFFLEELKYKLDKTGFFKDDQRREKMYQNISNIFMRNNLSGQEVKSLVGIFKALYNYNEAEDIIG